MPVARPGIDPNTGLPYGYLDPAAEPGATGPVLDVPAAVIPFASQAVPEGGKVSPTFSQADGSGEAPRAAAAPVAAVVDPNYFDKATPPKPSNTVPEPKAPKADGAPMTPGSAGVPAYPFDIGSGQNADKARLLAQAASVVGPDVSTTTQSVKPTKEFLSAKGDLKEAQDQDIAAKRRAGDFAVKLAKAKEEQAAREIAAHDAADLQAQKRRKVQEDTFKAAQTQLQSRRDELANFKPKELFGEDAPALGAVLVSGLGAFWSSFTGQANTVKAELDKAVERKAQQERERYMRLKDTVGEAKDALGEQRQAGADLEIKLLNEKAGLREALIRQREANILKFGGDAAKVETDQIIAGQRKEQAKELMQAEALLNKHVSSTVNNANQNALKLAALQAGAGVPDRSPNDKDVTQDQRNGNMYAEQVFGEMQRLNSLKPYSKKGQKAIEEYRRNVSEEVGQTAYTDAMKTITSLKGDLLKRLPAEDRQRFQAEQNIAIALVRKESGASYKGQEFVDKWAGFSQVGDDTAETAKQKRDRLAQGFHGLAQTTYQPNAWTKKLKGWYDETEGRAPAEAPKIAPADRAAAIKFVRDNPSDPRAASIRQALGL